MNQDLFNTILASTYTSSQLKKRLRSLKAYLDSKLFKAPLPNDLEEKDWLDSLGEEFYQAVTPDNFSDIIQSFEKQFDKLPKVVMSIPFDMPEADVLNIAKTLRTQRVDLILQIKHDPDLIGGCSLIYNGVLKDYSVRKRIEDNKQAILASLRSYLK